MNLSSLYELVVKHWVEVICGAVTGAMAWGYRKLTKKFRQEQEVNRAMREGMVAILRDRIIQLHNHYQDKGYCPIYGLENAHSLFEAYKGLGGNGTVAKLVAELENMPRKRKENHHESAR